MKLKKLAIALLASAAMLGASAQNAPTAAPTATQTTPSATLSPEIARQLNGINLSESQKTRIAEAHKKYATGRRNIKRMNKYRLDSMKLVMRRDHCRLTPAMRDSIKSINARAIQANRMEFLKSAKSILGAGNYVKFLENGYAMPKLRTDMPKTKRVGHSKGKPGKKKQAKKRVSRSNQGVQ